MRPPRKCAQAPTRSSERWRVPLITCPLGAARSCGCAGWRISRRGRSPEGSGFARAWWRSTWRRPCVALPMPCSARGAFDADARAGRARRALRNMPTSREIEAQAAEWLAQRDAPLWSSSDAAALEVWLAESTAHKVAYVRLEAAWNASLRLKALRSAVPPGEVPAAAL